EPFFVDPTPQNVVVIGSGVHIGRHLFPRRLGDSRYLDTATIGHGIPYIHSIVVGRHGDCILPRPYGEHFGAAEKLAPTLKIDHRRNTDRPDLEIVLDPSIKI